MRARAGRTLRRSAAGRPEAGARSTRSREVAVPTGWRLAAAAATPCGVPGERRERARQHDELDRAAHVDDAAGPSPHPPLDLLPPRPPTGRFGGSVARSVRGDADLVACASANTPKARAGHARSGWTMLPASATARASVAATVRSTSRRHDVTTYGDVDGGATFREGSARARRRSRRLRRRRSIRRRPTRIRPGCWARGARSAPRL